MKEANMPNCKCNNIGEAENCDILCDKRSADDSEPLYDELFDIGEDDFQECSECDGHDACRNFGCAIMLGLGHMVKKKDC